MAISIPIQPGDGRLDDDDRGRRLATVDSYDDAVRIVDALADAKFPVEHVAIVGRGVRTVENVQGRDGVLRAAGSAAFSGAMIGLFFGILFDWWGAVSAEVAWGWLALAGLGYGAIAGLVIGLLIQATGPRHEFSSVQTLEAEHYDVTLTGGERAEADRILHDAGLA